MSCIALAIGMKVSAQVPNPDFSANPIAGCGPLTVSFKDLSSGAPLYWEWDFGNGRISSQQNPTVTYTAPGAYTVTLIVRNGSGANSIRKTNYITVYPFPTAGLSADLTLGCVPVNIHFTDLSTPGQGTINQWSWNFGDGGTSSQQNPAHSYSQPGYYNISLSVTNTGGCTNTFTATRYIRVVQGIQPNFSWTQASGSCAAPYLINFLNQTAGPGNLSYAWDLGNGSTSTQPNPSTSYPSNTSYTVTLNAQSDLGCKASVQKTISFAGRGTRINSPDSACINTPITFGSTSFDTTLAYTWDFGDGTRSNASAPSKTYTTTGIYTVTLTSTHTSCTDITSKQVTILNNPVAKFSANQTAGCQAPFTVNFTDQSTGGAASWLWDFGDGNTSTLQNPSHTYTTTGSFDVSLTVSNAANCSGKTIQSKLILINPPTAAIANLPLYGCIGAQIKPIPSVNAPDGVASYSWSAPGATPSSSSAPNPVFTYAAQGNYDLTLTITTNGGCTSSTTFPNAVTIGTPVPATFSVTPGLNTCGRAPLTFTASPADYYSWDFGDGATGGDSMMITHNYSDTGFFTVRLTAFNHGCANQGTGVIIHVDPPIPNFSYRPDCANRLNVQFTDSSKIDPVKGATYTWDFGDGSTAGPITVTTPHAPPINHPYASLGIYTVTLTITNGACTNNYKKVINLNPPLAAFHTIPWACKNQDFTLVSTSTPADQIVSYIWQVGTKAFTTTTPTFTTRIGANGSYPLSLTVTDTFRCTNTSPTTSIDIRGPVGKFTPAASTGCSNTPMIFNDQSTPDPADGPIKTWLFYFGDGTTQSFTAPPFSHIYTAGGTYGVRMLINDVAGCGDTYQLSLPIQISAPVAGFYIKDTLPFFCPGKPLQFVDTSAGKNLIYQWDFGDGTTSSQASPQHIYTTNSQTYTVKMKISDPLGCADSVTKTNLITIQKPIPDFSMVDSAGICFPMLTTFTAKGQFYDSLYWDFGDGTTSTLPNTDHFFNSYDSFRVSLVLRGPGGCLDSMTRRVLVLNPYATTSFLYSPLKSCDSLLTNFTIIPPGFTRFSLFFGDNNVDSSGNTNPSHWYKYPSTYTPSLLLQDSSGCLVGIGGSPNITVLGAVPFFSMNKKAFCDSGSVSFTDFTITNDPPITRLLDFGDGVTTNQPNQEHRYVIPGIYHPTLKITTNSGCTETYADTVHIWATPHPIITPSGPYCINVPIQFRGSLLTPTIDSVNWSWNFGNGQSSLLQNPSLSFGQPGLYRISLRTSVSFGCTDTTSSSLTINPLPVINSPSVITTPVGMPVTIPFTYSPGVISYSWNPVTNLSCNNCSNPLAKPIFSTLYTVRVTDSNSCSSSDSILVKTICNDKNYFVPNTFSPNGDGVNDVFYPRGSNLYNIQSMRVFNRWGQLVFERKNFPANTPSDGWDGRFNGQGAPADVYVYIIEVICDNAQIVALKGDVTLVR